MQDISNDKNNYLGPDIYGNAWYGKINPDGTQTWTVVRDNKIINGGINATPNTYNPITGLSRLIKSNTKKGDNK